MGRRVKITFEMNADDVVGMFYIDRLKEDIQRVLDGDIGHYKPRVISMEELDIGITVRFPDVHHNHWGIELRYYTPMDEEFPKCLDFDYYIENAAKLKGWNPFHQGGHHGMAMQCGGWHYWEFWGLSGDEDHRAEVEEFIDQLQSYIDIYNMEEK